jgi:LAS superfamily LD-carboxypeptidase LdcB
MRVIEPAQQNTPNNVENNANNKKYLLIGGIVLAIIIGIILIFVNKANAPKIEVAPSSDQKNSNASATLGATSSLKSFTSEQFRDLYNSFAFPNTKDIIQPPEITGVLSADQRIYLLAEQRGYVLRSVVREPISSTSDNKQLQEKSVTPWEEMKKAATTDGINLFLLSAYRSVEDQRALFLEEISRSGLSSAQIANGSADSAINKILERAAPPGYSRHHTGYTIDISCPDQPNFIFARTSCFEWLSKNNYQNAKRFGWIPSYPENTEKPESWEYVWVGLSAVSQ